MNFLAKKEGEVVQMRTVTPLVNIRETDSAITLEAEMVGLEKDDITVDLRNDELTIRGVQPAQAAPKGFEVVYQERCPVEYKRTFVLGRTVDRNKIAASYENGVLGITLQKTAETQPKRITIS